MQRKYIGFFLGIGAFLAIILFANLEPGKPEVTATLAVAALMAIWWVTETVPLAVTALVPIVLFPALGILDGKAVSEVYMNHIIFVYVGGFMMALAMVVVAALIGVHGLGQVVLKAVNNQYLALGMMNGLAIVAIAIVFDRVSQKFGKRLQKHSEVIHG